MEVLVFILDNSALEELEQFTVKIEAIEGIFPVAVTNSTATVLIDDNDGNLKSSNYLPTSRVL